MKLSLLTFIVLLIRYAKADDVQCTKDQVLLYGECKNLVNFHNKCSDTKMCRTKKARCLDEKNQEYSYHPDKLDVGRLAFCQCPFRHEYSPQKNECLNFRKLCTDNSTCEKNYFCHEGLCTCLFENDKEKYSTHCLHQEISVVTCFKDPIRTICTNNTQRLDYQDPFMNINQTWTATMWKLSFLTVFLILLMLLIKGILRARQNEVYMNWARTIAMHQEALRNDGHQRSNRDISINVQSDSPPSYSDAIKQIQIQTDRQTQTSI